MPVQEKRDKRRSRIIQRLNVPTKTRRGSFHIIIENKEEKRNTFSYFEARRGKTGLRKFNFVSK